MIIGNLGRDPEVRHTTTGKSVCSFSVAVSKKKGNDTITEWFNVQAWEKLGENCAKYLAKGKKVYVEGEFESRKYEAKDGSGERTTFQINARNVVFLSPADDSGSRAGSRRDEYPDDDDAPF